MNTERTPHHVPLNEEADRLDLRYKVFFQLEDILGAIVAPDLLRSIETNNTHTVVFLGPPGVGKSTCAVQAGASLVDSGRKVRMVKYDEVLVATAEVLGKPDERWDDADWLSFAELYKKQTRRTEEDDIVLAEVVAVGVKDRGRQAILDLYEDSSEQKKVTILGFVPDRRNIERTSYVRRAVLIAQPSDVLAVLRSNNMHISSVPRTDNKEDHIYIGSQIQEKFRRMAPPEWIKVIDQEISAASEHTTFDDRTREVAQQIDLLERLLEAESEKMSNCIIDLTRAELSWLYRRRDMAYYMQLAGTFSAYDYRAVYNMHRQEDVEWPWSYFTNTTG